MLSPYQLYENDELTYEFITDQGVRYKIYFLDTSYLFEDYVSLKQEKVYSFNIDEVEQSKGSNVGFDRRIGLTVQYIFLLFFAQVNNVAIYVCDSLDNRQLARKRKFDSWFSFFADDTILKVNGEANMEGTKIYNAILVHRKNPKLEDFVEAFIDLNKIASIK